MPAKVENRDTILKLAVNELERIDWNADAVRKDAIRAADRGLESAADYLKILDLFPRTDVFYPNTGIYHLPLLEFYTERMGDSEYSWKYFLDPKGAIYEALLKGNEQGLNPPSIVKFGAGENDSVDIQLKHLSLANKALAKARKLVGEI